MTPLSAFFAASLGGAMLFFLAGFLSARRRDLAVATASPAVGDAPGMSPAAFDSLRAELEQSHQLVDEMQRERSRLVERLARAEQPDDWSADSDTAVQLDVLRRRAAEVDEIADENGRLKRTVEQLQKELASMRSTRTAAARAVPAPTAPPAVRLGTERGTEFALDRVLSKLVAQRGVEAVVLADDLGLPIAGAGDHTTALAALAGYLDDVTRKATEFTPLTTVQRLSIEDHASRAITVSPLTVGDSRIVLVALSSGATPSAAMMTKTLEGAARMI